MNVKQLRELIADLPDDMPVVLRASSSTAQPVVGIHIRYYAARTRRIAELDFRASSERALVLNR